MTELGDRALRDASYRLLASPLRELLAGEDDVGFLLAMGRGAEMYPQCFGLIPYNISYCCEGHVKLGCAILATARAAAGRL